MKFLKLRYISLLHSKASEVALLPLAFMLYLLLMYKISVLVESCWRTQVYDHLKKKKETISEQEADKHFIENYL